MHGEETYEIKMLIDNPEIYFYFIVLAHQA